ncbi:TetR/AcrR family transcriptional regulator [Polymorphospora rubra]|uniref:TetR family transcriptional regulator n=1 Tax=Polymorphospora rubra TaxID=338584 RepID=A0A810N393_9ACTN|nr:TetR/AcrR family transcriptional regulator C-terminal domain-containing protein [Polymorphospora rubra]BCJ68141.1 TetR family transcriptional regulator [Polymorphospora rubra]
MSDSSAAAGRTRPDRTRASDGRAGDVWFRPPRVLRDSPPLSRDRIVAAALELLDEEGVERLTMRRLAERLGAGSTTLYWHVKTKNDVLDLALDELFAEVELPRPDPSDWRATAVALLTGWRAAMLRHPWSAALLGRPLLGPNVLTRTEFLHATLAGAGFRQPHLTAAANALAGFVIGSALSQTAWQSRDGDDVHEPATRLLEQHRDRYPLLAARDSVVDDWDADFGRGLTYLLDGICATRA